ncbi:SPOR domain-containing protein [Lysobacter sp. BMK333-48F3]|uniref:SPOR domain-containing protein n=1 Tax=Lysobacter sp. BMK333-48F3 TaxID=2867962 RepID=UPI001C8B1853|nr:SPOR domain-containing protein [Lysobacter sp. BMK333-48F3]MBX9400200.1 SPOR domain-containing protein [Lysobacter sp. BMK333-48F3]
MLVRALIVLLIALNIGVAAWWIARPAPTATAEAALPLGVARLRLVDERADTGAASPAPTPAQAAAATPIDSGVAAPTAPRDPAAAPPVAEPAAAPAAAASEAAKPVEAALAAQAPAQCYSLGPFADAAAADAARTKLQPLAQKLVTRSQGAATAARGWRVYLPPAASRDAAQATAQRIRAAGFDDLFVMGEGADANGIALGRFRNEDSARKRAASLSQAGFPAQVQALGETSAATWIDVAATAADGDALRRAAGAQRWRSLSCSAMG